MDELADKRCRLMQAAERLFRAQQLHEITVDDVIREAGVGKGTVYRYFADKNDLFFQTAARGFDDMCEALQAAGPAGATFREAVIAACGTIRRFFNERRPLFRMILAEDDRTRIHGGGLRQRWLKHRKKMTQALAEVIARGVASGEIRGGAPPIVLAEYLLGLLRTCANELADADERWRSDEAVVDLLISGANGPGAPVEEPSGTP